MNRTESFAIRPRLRLGIDGQMTFLNLKRADVEQAHRRSLGITPDDELLAASEITETYRTAQQLAGETLGNCIVVFGASLREWQYIVTGKGVQNHTCSSIEWMLTRPANNNLKRLL